MGLIKAILKLIGFCLVVALIVGVIMGIVFIRKMVLNDSEIETMEQQYKIDTAAATKKEQWSYQLQKKKNKKKTVP